MEEEVQKMLSRYFHFLPFQSQAPVSSGKESLVFLIRGLILGNILTATVDIVGRIFGRNILGKILGNIDLNCRYCRPIGSIILGNIDLNW